jgi:AAHS family 4-hydroxybenzoate transporter-like MFS transporter
MAGNSGESVASGARIEARIEVGRLIDTRPLGLARIGVVVLCALVVLLDGYDIQVMSLAVPAVAQAWKIPPTDFGWALSASLIGIGIGGALVAPLADSRGRRPILIAAVILVGAATLASAYAGSVQAFVAWRLLTGVGLGASQPTAVTLVSEMMPARRRSLLVTVMFCNVAFGAVGASLVAPKLIALAGWRGLFLAGGAGTLLLAVLLILALPESLRFLIARRPGHPKIPGQVRAIAPEVDPAAVYVDAERVRPAAITALLGQTYAGRTLLIWSIYALNAFVAYMLISWLPTLLRQAGWSLNHALLGIAFYQGGSVLGGLALSWSVDAGRPRTGLAIGYAVSGAALAALNFVPHGFGSWGALIAVIGAGVAGAQFILIALSAEFYPLAIRATGVGWTGMISRIGAASAPLAGAWLIRRFAPGEAMALLIVPILLCTALALVIRREWRT